MKGNEHCSKMCSILECFLRRYFFATFSTDGFFDDDSRNPMVVFQQVPKTRSGVSGKKIGVYKKPRKRRKDPLEISGIRKLFE